MQKSIIQVTPFYPPHLGGMENVVFEITQKLRERKFEVLVLTSNIGAKLAKQKKVKYLDSIEVANTPIIFGLFKNLLATKNTGVVHVHISQAFTPEIVYLYSALKKVPYIAHVHLDVDASGFFGFLLMPYKKIFLRHVLRNAAKVIVLTPMQKKQIKSLYKIPDRQIEIVPNGVSANFFMKRSAKRKYSRFLYVGRLAHQKNIVKLIEIFSKIKSDVSLDVVGEGSERSNIESKIKELGLKNVSLHGERKGRDLLKFYKRSDFYITASKKEGASLAMLEAMAASLVVIAPDSPGISEMVEGAAFIEKGTDSDKFAASIERLIKNPKRIAELSKRSYARAKKFTWEISVNKLINLYSEVYEN
ncbi:MAG TPA: glycosyltransferase family 4 protein [Patescibacteria group bacterium]|nr:glycosyltransferase family 4 protein [Patescibacteria group bacterium]